MESLGVGRTFPYLPSLLRDQTQQGIILSRKRRSREQSLESLGVGTTSPYLTSLLRDHTQQWVILSIESRSKEQSLESLGVGTTSPYLTSLLRDQTQQGLFSHEKEEDGKKVRSPWASGELPHTLPPCCVTRLNKAYSLVRRKKQGTKFGVPGHRENFPKPHLLAA